MLSITCGRRFPRPPILCRADDVVDVLGANNERAKLRAGDLRPGVILFGHGVVVRIDDAAEAA